LLAWAASTGNIELVKEITKDLQPINYNTSPDGNINMDQSEDQEHKEASEIVQSEADDQPQQESIAEDAPVDHADNTVTSTAAAVAPPTTDDDDSDANDDDGESDGINPAAVDIVRPINLKETVDDLTVIEIAALAGQREIVHYLRSFQDCTGVRSSSHYHPISLLLYNDPDGNVFITLETF
jgi:hypothetical protein